MAGILKFLQTIACVLDQTCWFLLSYPSCSPSIFPTSIFTLHLKVVTNKPVGESFQYYGDMTHAVYFCKLLQAPFFSPPLFFFFLLSVSAWCGKLNANPQKKKERKKKKSMIPKRNLFFPQPQEKWKYQPQHLYVMDYQWKETS